MRLRERATDLEQAVVVRIRAAAPADEHAESEYLHGLRAAIRAAIDFSFDSIEAGDRETPIPTDLLLQARLAARHGVPVGTMLRRYTLGSNQLNDFVAAEAEHDNTLTGCELRQILRGLAITLERVLIELEEEYAREPQERLDSSEARLARRIKRRLAGEIVDLSDLNYSFRGHHVGMVAEGDEAPGAIRSVAKAIDGRLLLLRAQEELIWAWIGTRNRIDSAHFYSWVGANWPARLPLALGPREAAAPRIIERYGCGCSNVCWYCVAGPLP